MQTNNECDQEEIIAYVNEYLLRLIAFSQNKRQGLLTSFHARKPPTITILGYLQRIMKFAPCSQESLIMSIVYIKRLLTYNPDISLCEYNVHRLLIASFVIAIKCHEDKYFSNQHMSKVGGVKNGEINELELLMLLMLNFDIKVEWDEFKRVRDEIVPHSNIQPTVQIVPMEQDSEEIKMKAV